MIEESYSTDPSVNSSYFSNHAGSTSSQDKKGKGLASNILAKTFIYSIVGPEIILDLLEASIFPFLDEDATFGSKSIGHIQETISNDFLPSEVFFSNDLHSHN